MKKLLLSALALSVAYFSFAQDLCDTPGFAPDGIYDDFSSEAEIGDANGGIWIWSIDPAENPGSASVFERTGNGVLSISMTQPKGGYAPFGISFGEDEETDVPHSIDLTNNKTVQALVTNNDSEVDVLFRIALQDINGNQITHKPGTYAIGGAWAFPFEITVPAGEELEYDFNYEGGRWAYYATAAEKEAGEVDRMIDDFDWTKVTGVLITIVNAQQTNPAAEDYDPIAIENLPIELSYIRIGSCITGILKPKVNSNINIAPNPASSNAQLTYEANTSNVVVNVSDMMGNVVRTFEGSANASNINVSGLNKGMYIVTIVADGTPVSARKLMVD